MSTHRRRISGRNKAIGGLAAAAVVGGGALVVTGTAQAAGAGAREPSSPRRWTR
ncbi:hypothetical protein ACFXDP_08080 [Streptomyces sp. NPDC059374]|uniref:hypothetical protein n=1 Tax=Streptomyces sp. NPDC059374 TaxID=3346814 RepID=UPI0036A8B5D7